MNILYAILVIWSFILICCNAKTKWYIYQGHKIKVYAGWVNHYIMIDGEIVDSEKNGFAFSIRLNANIDNALVTVKIGQGLLGNIITTFIDGKLAEEVYSKSEMVTNSENLDTENKGEN
jgi:hypothetical protein